MEQGRRRTRVAIACQGGGSHTAFTAGVLRRLLPAEELRNHQIVGLSGTSGGAICALLAWYALLEEDPQGAARLLTDFWADNAASSPPDRLLNLSIVWASKVANYVAVPAISPYDNPFAGVGLRQLRRLLTRRVDFDQLPARINTADTPPLLLVGAVDVLSGRFKAFDSRKGEITAEAILASAAIPSLFRSVPAAGGLYWDGLFSQNPPVRDLLDVTPDEIWVIQINPRELASEPRTVVEIADRRNELSGNLSLNQELHFIEKIDQLLDEGMLPADGRYRPVVVRVIELARSRLSRVLGPASKLNRDPAFLHDLLLHGEQRAEEFLIALAWEDAWRDKDHDALVDLFVDDAEVLSLPPFTPRGPVHGITAVRAFVAEQLAAGVYLDRNRRQVARDWTSWTAHGPKSDTGDRPSGRVWARFGRGGITDLHVGGTRPA